jgi:hypothetical protein
VSSPQPGMARFARSSLAGFRTPSGVNKENAATKICYCGVSLCLRASVPLCLCVSVLSAPQLFPIRQAALRHSELPAWRTLFLFDKVVFDAAHTLGRLEDPRSRGVVIARNERYVRQ